MEDEVREIVFVYTDKHGVVDPEDPKDPQNPNNPDNNAFVTYSLEYVEKDTNPLVYINETKAPVKYIGKANTTIIATARQFDKYVLDKDTARVKSVFLEKSEDISKPNEDKTIRFEYNRDENSVRYVIKHIEVDGKTGAFVKNIIQPQEFTEIIGTKIMREAIIFKDYVLYGGEIQKSIILEEGKDNEIVFRYMKAEGENPEGEIPEEVEPDEKDYIDYTVEHFARNENKNKVQFSDSPKSYTGLVGTQITHYGRE